MLRFAFFCLGYVYAPAVIAAASLRGPWVLIPAALTFVALPILDLLLGRSLWNPPPELESKLARAPVYRLVTWIWVPTALAVTGYAIAAAAAPSWSWPERLGLAVGVGLMNTAMSINYAHELVHQANRFEVFLGEVLLNLTSYTHFRIEHVFGHHRYVATPRDPATARFHESFYAFLPRSVAAQIASAWDLECRRLARAVKPAIGASNRMLWYASALAITYAAVAAFFGWIGVVFFAVQSVVAFSSLEVINYLEHYGLTRQARPDGSGYERVRPHHSWNSPHRVTNWFLINLARHSDHHANAGRRWQLLRTFDEQDAPQLPAGYATMYLLALVPPLWFAVMDPRVERWKEQHA
jgi:alkane 1-monooxygenase